MIRYFPTNQDIQKLDKEANSIAVSIYSPLDNDSPEAVNSNHIRIKNILSDIEKIIATHKGTFHTSKQKLTKPLQDMLYDKKKLWQRQYRSIVIFMNENKLRYYFLPTSSDSKTVTVSDSYKLGPLHSYIANNQEYYILSASYNHVSLYEANEYSISETEIPDLPKDGVEKTLQIDEYPNSLQLHPAGKKDAKSTSDRHGFEQGFHGHYNQKEVEKGFLKQYFRMVDKAVTKHLKTSNKPLVFAGVEYLFPIYQSVNSYKNLQPEPVEGNFEHTREEELHKRTKRALSKQR